MRHADFTTQDGRAAHFAWLYALPEAVYEAFYLPVDDLRTITQNARFWAMCGELAQAVGFPEQYGSAAIATRKIANAVLRRMCDAELLEWDVNTDIATGEQWRDLPSTKDLTKQQFSVLIDQLRAYEAELVRGGFLPTHIFTDLTP